MIALSRLTNKSTLGFVLFAGVVIFIIIGLFHHQANDTEAVDLNRKVSESVQAVAEPLTPELKPLVMEVKGVLNAWHTSNISMKASGTVSKVNTKGFGFFPAGYSLAYLKSEGRQASYLQAQSRYEAAQLNFASVKKLYRQKLVSKTEYLEAKAGLDQAKSGLRMAATQSKNLSVTVPYDAWVSGVDIEVGSFVKAGQVVARAYDLKLLKLKASMPVVYFDYVKIGSLVKLIVGDQSKPLKGYIESIDAEVDASSQTFSIQVKIPNPEGHVVPIRGRVLAQVFGPKMPMYQTDLSNLTASQDGRPALRVLSKGGKVSLLPVVVFKTGSQKVEFFLPSRLHLATNTLPVFTFGSALLNEGDKVQPVDPQGQPSDLVPLEIPLVSKPLAGKHPTGAASVSQIKRPFKASASQTSALKPRPIKTSLPKAPAKASPLKKTAPAKVAPRKTVPLKVTPVKPAPAKPHLPKTAPPRVKHLPLDGSSDPIT